MEIALIGLDNFVWMYGNIKEENEYVIIHLISKLYILAASIKWKRRFTAKVFEYFLILICLIFILWHEHLKKCVSID